MNFDINKKHCFYFNEVSKIPHGSFNEKALSDYIVEFAKRLNLMYFQDEMHNVIVYKDKNGDYSDEPIMIQAHIDMVCEKNRDVDHDFFKDPLELEVNDGILSAKGTTLGADDGHGVAYMLAILADKSLKHPPLECVFTTQEEVGLMGAMNIKKENIRAIRMISLDGGGESSTLLTSAGGVYVSLSKDVSYEKTNKPGYLLSIKGLLGGHSGGEIHKEKGNANFLLVRALKIFELNNVNYELGDIQGGLKINAIPREASCTFASDVSFTKLKELVKEIDAIYKNEFEFSDNLVNLTIEETVIDKVYPKKLKEDFLNALYLAPNGFVAKSMVIKDLTVTSLNLGLIEQTDNILKATYSIRSSIESSIDELINRIKVISEIFDLKFATDCRFPGWNYSKTSNMRDVLAEVVPEVIGRPLELIATHGGTECGVFKALDQRMDIVSLGPITDHIHTPDEIMDLASFDRVYDLLTVYISRLK